MLLTGVKQCAKQIHSKLLDLKKKIKEVVVDWIPKCSSFLDFFKQNDVILEIERTLQVNGILAVVRVDSRVLKIYSFHDFDAAQETLKRMFRISCLNFGLGEEEIMQGEAWSTFIYNLHMQFKQSFTWSKSVDGFFMLAFSDDSEGIMFELSKYFTEKSKKHEFLGKQTQYRDSPRNSVEFDEINVKAG